MSIREKIQSNVYHLINLLTGRLAGIERKLMKLQEDVDRQFAIQRAHMVRLKNRELVSDDFLARGLAYNDLSPERAWELFKRPDFDYVFLDVSFDGFEPQGPRPSHAIHIPLEELELRYEELPQNNSTPILIISEEGLRSVLACEFLAGRGLFNCNNVSGGWRHWPGHRFNVVGKEETA